MSRVQCHGGELDRVETYRGTTVKMELAGEGAILVGPDTAVDGELAVANSAVA
jgi:hypothetical protein